MKIVVRTKIGTVDYQFEIEESDDKKSLEKAITLGNPRRYCDVCSNKSINSFVLQTNRGSNEKGSFTYIKCRCIACGATSTLGEYQTGDGYFWKKFEKYEKNESNNNEGSSA